MPGVGGLNVKEPVGQAENARVSPVSSLYQSRTSLHETRSKLGFTVFALTVGFRSSNSRTTPTTLRALTAVSRISTVPSGLAETLPVGPRSFRNSGMRSPTPGAAEVRVTRTSSVSPRPGRSARRTAGTIAGSSLSFVGWTRNDFSSRISTSLSEASAWFRRSVSSVMVNSRPLGGRMLTVTLGRATEVSVNPVSFAYHASTSVRAALRNWSVNRFPSSSPQAARARRTSVISASVA